MEKILIFAKETRGGAGTFLKDLESFNLPEFKFIFCLFRKDNYCPLKKYLLINKSYPSDFKLSFTKIYLLALNIFRSYKIINKEKPLLVMAADLYSIIVLALVKLLFKRNIIFVAQINNDFLSATKEHPNYFFQLLIELTMRKLLPLATKFVFVSKELLNFYSIKMKLIKNKCVTIHNGITNFLNFKKKNISNNKINILSVGRFDRQKDFKTIVLAFNMLSKKYTNIQLLLVGDGEQKDDLLKLSQKLHLKSRIKFFGWRNNIYTIMNKADIFVFSSNYEGFPYVLIEAMSCGLPIIATKCQFGVSELLNNGEYGILVEVGNPTQMAENVEKFILNKKLRRIYSNKSLKRAKIFTLERMKKKYKNFFLSFVKKCKKTARFQ
jgi:glycosyltransferase involved in cell wall biosynthesis